MDLLKLKIGRLHGDVGAPRSLFDFRFGGPIDPRMAVVELDIGDTEGLDPARTLSVGLGSLLCGTAGMFAANGIVGWMEGSLGSVSDLMANNLDSSDGIGANGVFAACFVTSAVVAEIARRWVRGRSERLQDRVIATGAAEAMSRGDGMWVVGPANAFEGASAGRTFGAWARWARNEATVLDQEGFARFEARVAESGCILRKYRMEPDGGGTVMTLRRGVPHSVGAEPAYQVMRDGVFVSREWYRDGVRTPPPVKAGVLLPEDVGALAVRDGGGGDGAVLRQALALVERAAERIAGDVVRDDRAAATEGRSYMVRADALLRTAFGDEYLPLEPHVENFDGLIEWPEPTVTRFAGTVLNWLGHLKSSLVSRIVAHEAPELASLATDVVSRLKETGRRFSVSLSRFGDLNDAPMLTVADEDDEGLARVVAQFVWSEDAWFGRPTFGEVVGRSVAWRPDISADEVMGAIAAIDDGPSGPRI